MMAVKKDMLIWGSGDLLKAWNDFELEGEKGESGDVLGSVDRVFRAIR